MSTAKILQCYFKVLLVVALYVCNIHGAQLLSSHSSYKEVPNYQDMNAGSDYLEIQEKARLLIFKRFIHGVSLNLCCLPFAGDHSLSQGHRKSQSGTSFYPFTPNREVLQNADSWTASETLKHQKGQIHTYLIFFFFTFQKKDNCRVVIVVFVSNWRKNPGSAFHQNCPVV